VTAAAAASVRRRAILCVLAASACFSVSAALIKAVGATIPAVEIALFRGLVMGAIVALRQHRRGGLAVLARTRRPWGHVARTLCGFAGMVTSYYGYATLPLAANTALGFAMPLVLTALSGPFLGERVGPHRAAAVLAGLVGVLVMVRPWDADAPLPLIPALVVLAGVVAWAGSMISIRQLGQGGESNETIILWFCLGTVLLAGVATVPVWIPPGPRELAGLVGIGAVTTVAQLLMTEGYRTGEATVVAPFEYGAIIYTTLIGMLLWAEFPDIWSWAGIGVIVAAGLYVWHRETRGDAVR
jgi:drug/metabolite transporter (DMT)-like permease